MKGFVGASDGDERLVSKSSFWRQFSKSWSPWDIVKAFNKKHIKKSNFKLGQGLTGPKQT